jgi:hypothetical protein
MYCEQCGDKLDTKAKFCASCIYSLVIHAVDQKNSLNVEAVERTAKAPNWWRNIIVSDVKIKENFMKSFQAELSKYPELNTEQIARAITDAERNYVNNSEGDYVDLIWDESKKIFKRVISGILVLTAGLMTYLFLIRK